MESYEQIVPGAAERILAAFERQGEHRRRMATQIAHARIRDATAERREYCRGQVYGLIVTLAALALVPVVLFIDRGVSGTIVSSVLGGGTLTGLAAVFLRANGVGRRLRHRGDSRSEAHADP